MSRVQGYEGANYAFNTWFSSYEVIAGNSFGMGASYYSKTFFTVELGK